MARFKCGRSNLKGKIDIPKAIRDALNLSVDAKLRIELRGQEIVLSREPGWKKLEGAAAGTDLVKAFAAQKKRTQARNAALTGLFGLLCRNLRPQIRHARGSTLIGHRNRDGVVEPIVYRTVGIVRRHRQRIGAGAQVAQE